jgi:light-regulated signal transduction histidine kinase (bacteriophytochrome)
MPERLHSKNQYEGSCIGLATCQKIMNDHEGEIYIQSVPEGGSDFVCTFPKI